MLLSSPFIIAAFFVGRAMKRRGRTSNLAIILFSLLLTLLIAPIPSPIITIFYPNIFGLFDGTYIHIIKKRELYTGIRPWIRTSLMATAPLLFIISRDYIRKEEKKKAIEGEKDNC